MPNEESSVSGNSGRQLGEAHLVPQALVELVQLAGAGIESEERSRAFVASFRRLVSFDELLIMQALGNGKGLQVWSACAPPGGVPAAGDTVPFCGSAGEEAMRRGETLLRADISSGPRFAGDEALLQRGIRTVMSIPLQVAGRPFGLMELRALKSGLYGEAERTLVEEACLVLSSVIWCQREAAAQRERCLELEEQGRMREEFLAMLAHEIRTPLTPIVGSAKMLGEEFGGAPGSAQNRLVRNVLRGVDDLNARVSDLLDKAQVLAGVFSVKRELFDPAKALSDLAERFRPVAESRKLAFSVELPGDLPMLEADQGRFGQIVLNLLNNAVKFTPEGGRVRLAAAAREGQLVVKVHDSGAPLSDGEKEKLFRPYYRSSSGPRGSSHVGWGLFICRQLVEAHGGRIWVESRPGAEKYFAFALPLDGFAARGVEKP